MDIKKILLPVEPEVDEKLYYRRDDKVSVMTNGGLKFQLDGQVDFDTYFNSFSTGKWKKYTVVENVQIALVIKGVFSVELVHQFLENKVIQTEVISSTEVSSNELGQFVFDFGKNRSEGIYFFKCHALAEESEIHEGRYLSDKLLSINLNINIMVDICTFKREEFVYRNLSLLKRDILENPDSALYRHLYVHVSDNAKTLDPTIADGNIIKITPNRNVGGVGGFTRGIIEAMSRSKERDISHVLLMDDDAMIEPACLETTYTFLTVLKEEYKDYTMGGSIIQLDKSYLQFEEGAQWNVGNIKALKHKVDLRDMMNLLKNEDESEKVEYTGWWYCCIPLSVINKENLPLPVFIHRDDVEYGLRTGKGFIYLNGVGVWHEAFENKIPGPLEYYDIRNHCIVNAIHYPEYGAKDFKKMLFKWASGNILRYRYQYMEMNLRGVEDFLKGIDWFLKHEAEPLHQEISKMNYKAQPKENYIKQKGLQEAEFEWERLLKPDNIIIPRWKKILQMLCLNGNIFPAKKNKVLITSPYCTFLKLFRIKEVIFVDAAGNSILTERSFRRMVQSYRNVFKMMRRIDKEYDKAKKTYHDRYRELTNIDFWRKYLEM